MPKQVQTLHAEISRLDNYPLSAQDVAALDHSLSTNGCFLNSVSRSVAHRFATSPLSLLVVKDNKRNLLVLLEIWPRSLHNHSNQQRIIRKEPSVQVAKIIHGSVLYSWYNSPSSLNAQPIRIELAERNSVTWSTPEYYSTYASTNNNNSDIALALRVVSQPHPTSSSNLEDERTSFEHVRQYDFGWLLGHLRKEFASKQCDASDSLEQRGAKIDNCTCHFIGTKCGSTLTDTDLADCIHVRFDANSLYRCGEVGGRLSLVEKCSPQMRCANDERCVEELRGRKAFVRLEAAKASRSGKTYGTLTFEQLDERRVRIVGAIRGLTPNAQHAMHIHEYGVLGNECRETGPHFNPLMRLHGAREDHLADKHSGDLGNLVTNKRGHTLVNLTITNGEFNIQGGNFFSVLGRSLVVHQNRDDLGRTSHVSSRSNGNSGTRIACGLILPITNN